MPDSPMLTAAAVRETVKARYGYVREPTASPFWDKQHRQLEADVAAFLAAQDRDVLTARCWEQMTDQHPAVVRQVIDLLLGTP